MNVTEKLKRRRGQDTESMAEHRRCEARFLDGLDETVRWMSASAVAALAEHTDDINTASTLLREGMQRCLKRLLKQTASATERVVFFHEAIPGFTVLAVKKQGWGHSQPGRTNDIAPPAEDDLAEERDAALRDVMKAYVTRTGNRVLSIEGTDMVLILFPVDDLKKNLQEMGVLWG